MLQREVADPALHVGTWQRDAGLDPAAPATRRAGRRLAGLDGRASGCRPSGSAFLTLRRTERAPTVVFEDLPGELDDPLGPEVEGWLDRVDWLRGARRRRDAARARGWRWRRRCCWRPTPSPDPTEGWAEVGSAVVPPDGPRWRHEVDAPAAALLAGCQGRCRSGELVELLALAHDRPTGELVAATLPAVRELVRHGLLVPAP